MWSLLLASLGLGSAALVAWGIRKAVEPIPLVTQALPNDETSPCALVSDTGETEQDDAMQTARRSAYRDTSSHRTGPSAKLRTRTMARQPSASETAVQRVARRADEDREEMRAGFASILESIESIRTEVRRGAQNSGQLEQRFNDLEWQVNLTRDEVQRRAVVPSPSQVQSAKTAIKDAAKSWQGKLVAGCIGLMAIISVCQNIPDVARAWDRIWAFMREMDQPPVAAPKDDHKH